MSAKIMLGAATAAVTACGTASAANTAAGTTGAGYGPAMAVTLSTTLPIITTSMATIITILTPAFPIQISPPTAKVRPENALKVNADLAIIVTLIGIATTESVASLGAPSPTFPTSVLNITNSLSDLTGFITEKFVKELTF